MFKLIGSSYPTCKFETWAIDLKEGARCIVEVEMKGVDMHIEFWVQRPVPRARSVQHLPTGEEWDEIEPHMVQLYRGLFRSRHHQKA